MNYKNDSPINRKVTPPTKGKVRNPFDKVLIENLHKPICSPGMCKIYKKKRRGSFRWDIDQACTLVPADIVACNSQFEPSPDPALEKIAEEANDKFFSQEMVMPSPMETSKKVKPLQTSLETSVQITSFVKETIISRDVSAQTVLTLPPKLPPELESILQTYCTYTQEPNQSIFDEYEITANGSLRRKLFFEERDIENSDAEQYDSEQTDDEIHVETRPSLSYEAHNPINISPYLSCDPVTKGMKRTFGTPLHKEKNKPCYRNRILDEVELEACLSPIEHRTPSASEECVSGSSRASRCGVTLSGIILTRSTSLGDSSPRRGQGSASGSGAPRRSLSVSSLSRSRSVQRLDFSMDMSVEGGLDESLESSPKTKSGRSAVEDSSAYLAGDFRKDSREVRSSTKIFSVNILDDTPIKGKRRSAALAHEISKIRAPMALGPSRMSLDNSLDNSDAPPATEDDNIDFGALDPALLSRTAALRRVDSGYNENTFYANASGYYESAIKPSELTVTERSRVAWRRVDSGFNETDGGRLCGGEGCKRLPCPLSGAEAVERGSVEDFRTIRVGKHEPTSMSDSVAEDLTFDCNFSSTPSKTKTRRVDS